MCLCLSFIVWYCLCCCRAQSILYNLRHCHANQSSYSPTSPTESLYFLLHRFVCGNSFGTVKLLLSTKTLFFHIPHIFHFGSLYVVHDKTIHFLFDIFFDSSVGMKRDAVSIVFNLFILIILK